jgi:2-polyprenyl-3-methyl-5-hydroxy-6-metoxy-1,4-benzoquinol methylase
MKCLFCGSHNIKKAKFPRKVSYNHTLFNYHSCRKCKLVFIDPLPTTADYEKMYSVSYHDKFYFNNEPKHPGAIEVAEQFIQGKKILDYGCGDASFIKTFHRKGYSCIGVEYEKELVQRLQNETEGIQFFTPEEFFLNAKESSFSMIHLGDVLEHVAEPNELLAKLHKYLIKGSGVLFVEGPLEK